MRLLGKGVVLACGIGACAFDLRGEGVARQAESVVTTTGQQDIEAGADGAAGCDGCSPLREEVVDAIDDRALFDDTRTTNVRVAEGAAGLFEIIDTGNGADGPCNVLQGDVDPVVQSCSARPTPDAPLAQLAVDAPAGATQVSVTNLLPGLAAGDEIVVAVMQSSNVNVVGRAEFHRVAVVNGTNIALVAPLVNAHSALDRVTVQRVPNYSALDVAGKARILARQWNGFVGGLLVIRVMGAASILGALDASRAGYRTTARPPAVTNENGYAGESYSIGYVSSRSRSPNGGGGGAGLGDLCGGRGVGGAGGGHGAAGANGGDFNCSGFGGGIYGGAGRLTLGSSGGSGGNDNTLSNNPVGGAGGAGGGAISIEASAITVSGAIAADGAGGQGDNPPCVGTSSSTSMCWDFSGPGGGGAGGSIRLRARSIALGNSLVVARGGAAGVGVGNFGGAGGAGRVFGGAATWSGTSAPPHVAEPFYAVSGQILSKDLLAGRAAAKSFESIRIELKSRPTATRVRLLVSTDGNNWRPAMPPGTDTLESGETIVPLGTVLAGAGSFYYRMTFDSDGLATPLLDRVSVAYLR